MAGNRPFFMALYRVQEIRNECSKLLGSKHQSAGFELLEVSEHISRLSSRPLAVLPSRVTDGRAPRLCGVVWCGDHCPQTLSEHQEAGFRRLHNWILQRCNMLDSHQQDDVEENDVTLSMGLKVIRYADSMAPLSSCPTDVTLPAV